MLLVSGVVTSILSEYSDLGCKYVPGQNKQSFFSCLPFGIGVVKLFTVVNHAPISVVSILALKYKTLL
jgi:hypothetical protein